MTCTLQVGSPCVSLCVCVYKGLEVETCRKHILVFGLHLCTQGKVTEHTSLRSRTALVRDDVHFQLDASAIASTESRCSALTWHSLLHSTTCTADPNPL